MDLKKYPLIVFNFALYLFAFLFIFFVIYTSYIYCFGLKIHPCMNDKCIKERENK